MYILIILKNTLREPFQWVGMIDPFIRNELNYLLIDVFNKAGRDIKQKLWDTKDNTTHYHQWRKLVKWFEVHIMLLSCEVLWFLKPVGSWNVLLFLNMNNLKTFSRRRVRSCLSYMSYSKKNAHAVIGFLIFWLPSYIVWMTFSLQWDNLFMVKFRMYFVIFTMA